MQTQLKEYTKNMNKIENIRNQSKINQKHYKTIRNTNNKIKKMIEHKKKLCNDC